MNNNKINYIANLSGSLKHFFSMINYKQLIYLSATKESVIEQVHKEKVDDVNMSMFWDSLFFSYGPARWCSSFFFVEPTNEIAFHDKKF